VWSASPRPGSPFIHGKTPPHSQKCRTRDTNILTGGEPVLLVASSVHISSASFLPPHLRSRPRHSTCDLWPGTPLQALNHLQILGTGEPHRSSCPKLFTNALFPVSARSLSIIARNRAAAVHAHGQSLPYPGFQALGAPLWFFLRPADDGSSITQLSPVPLLGVNEHRNSLFFLPENAKSSARILFPITYVISLPSFGVHRVDASPELPYSLELSTTLRLSP
jgi:hypothetical protein